MSAPRGKRTERSDAAARLERREAEKAGARSEGSRNEPAGRVPDLLRRLLGLGFAGLFTTEEVLRKALGDSVPKDWIEFAAQQSERTRRELVDRVAAEVGRTLDGIDVRELAARLLQGHTLEVNAQIRFVARDPAGGPGEAARAARRLRLDPAREEDET
jgi:hypothetical protein